MTRRQKDPLRPLTIDERQMLEQRQVIVHTIQQAPELEKDGTGHWSLSILQRHLRSLAEFSKISTYTLWRVLHEENWSWQASRSWCQTGKVTILRGICPKILL